MLHSRVPRLLAAPSDPVERRGGSRIDLRTQRTSSSAVFPVYMPVRRAEPAHSDQVRADSVATPVILFLELPDVPRGTSDALAFVLGSSSSAVRGAGRWWADTDVGDRTWGDRLPGARRWPWSGAPWLPRLGMSN